MPWVWAEQIVGTPLEPVPELVLEPVSEPALELELERELALELVLDLVLELVLEPVLDLVLELEVVPRRAGPRAVVLEVVGAIGCQYQS